MTGITRMTRMIGIYTKMTVKAGMIVMTMTGMFWMTGMNLRARMSGMTRMVVVTLMQ